MEMINQETIRENMRIVFDEQVVQLGQVSALTLGYGRFGMETWGYRRAC